MARLMLRLLTLLVVAVVVGWPGAARAAEGQWHVGAGLGAATFSGTGSGFGPALGLQGAYELTDMFDLHLELSASQHELAPATSTRFYGASAGAVYKVDVIEWVPYFGLYAGVYRFDGEVIPTPLKQTELGIAVPLGLDYSFSRSFAVGVQLRYHGFLSDPMSSLGDAPYFLGLLRAEYRPGW
ncbi:MAG: outer membrane beta-barrel protein [Polyangiaceae bacterium]|nr:outer membrane beta-barrel protein [Polyangiaceae bacterium]